MLTESYFTGELIIPGLDSTSPANESQQALIKEFIARKEAEFLTLLLGKTLYDQFAAGIAVSPADAKWTALEAKIYTSLVYDSKTYYTSPAANYVWFRWYENEQNRDVQPVFENASYVGGRQKMINIWNQMSAAVDEFWIWLLANYATYGMSTTATPFVGNNPFGRINNFSA